MQVARHERHAFTVRKQRSGARMPYQFNKDYENMKKNLIAGFSTWKRFYVPGTMSRYFCIVPPPHALWHANCRGTVSFF